MKTEFLNDSVQLGEKWGAVHRPAEADLSPEALRAMRTAFVLLSGPKHCEKPKINIIRTDRACASKHIVLYAHDRLKHVQHMLHTNSTHGPNKFNQFQEMLHVV